MSRAFAIWPPRRGMPRWPRHSLARRRVGRPVPAPPFVDHVEWAQMGRPVQPAGLSRRTRAAAAGQPGTAAQADEAWAEVLALSPDADIPGMREQFICHWQFAELAEPGKTSWNLEPWRPEVDDERRCWPPGCNPGGTEEPF